MFGTTRRCQINGCNRAASANCFCCNANICKRHLTEHIDALKTQIDPLTNETKQMIEKFHDLTIEKLTESSFIRLHQWKNDMHEMIDEIFSNKIKDIEDFIDKNKETFIEYKNQQLETILKIENDLKELIEDGDATFDQIVLLKKQLTNVETNLNNFEKDFLSIHTEMITNSLVTISTNLNNRNRQFPSKSREFRTNTALFTSPNHVTVATFPLDSTTITSSVDEHRNISRNNPATSTSIFASPVLVPTTDNNSRSKYSLPSFDEKERK